MIIKINRLYHGKASPRDYQVKEALDKGEDLIFLLGSKKMTIKNADIKNGYINPTWLESKHTPGLKYRLVDYSWREDKENPYQDKLL